METTWKKDAQHVVRALRYIRSKGGITAEQLVEWDQMHGRKLFEWNNETASHEFRLVQARWFFNRFRLKIGEFRVRQFIHLPADGDADNKKYLPIEEITEQPEARELVIGDLTRRMKSIAMELRFWKLTDRERDKIIETLRKALEE